MIENTQTLKLHDIKDIVEIPDNSFLFLVLISIFCFILLIILIVFVTRMIKRKKPNRRKEYLSNLKNIDFSNSKKSAYEISKYSRLLAKTPREIKLANELIEELDKYKYKKEVDKIDDNIKAKLSIFMESLDVW